MAVSELAGLLTSVKAATDVAKILKDSTTSLEQAEINFKISELMVALAEARSEIADIQGVILEKDETIAEINRQLNLKKSVVWADYYYYVEDSEKRDGPYCQKCYDNENKLIRLMGGNNGSWKCRVCCEWHYDSTYVKPDKKAPKRRARPHSRVDW